MGFRLESQNRFAQLLTLETQLKSELKKLKYLVFVAAGANLGHSRRLRGDWISDPTLELADLMQQARVSGGPEHTNLQQSVMRATPAIRNAHWLGIVEETVRAAAIGYTQKL